MDYELKTIKDIFEKVPSDRIQVCCNELATLLIQSKAITEMTDAVGEIIGEDARTVFPDTVIWRDDGEGAIDIGIVAHGDTEPLIRFRSKVKSDSE